MLDNRLVQLGELFPWKGIWYQVVDASGQHAGTPDQIVLRPYSFTMSSLKRESIIYQRGKRLRLNRSQYGPPSGWQEKPK